VRLRNSYTAKARILTNPATEILHGDAGTGANNYQTLASHGGPRHVINATKTTLFPGGGVDGEAGTQQSAAANLDNLFTTGGRNDEDGVMSSLDLTATIGSSPKITLSATNTTGTTATLYGWKDDGYYWQVRANGPNLWSVEDGFQVARKIQVNIGGAFIAAGESWQIYWNHIPAAHHYDL